jgi:hypothetical protein
MRVVVVVGQLGMEEGVEEKKKEERKRSKMVQRTEGVCGREHVAACIQIKRRVGNRKRDDDGMIAHRPGHVLW